MAISNERDKNEIIRSLPPAPGVIEGIADAKLDDVRTETNDRDY